MPSGTAPVRPRDAASLVLVRRVRGGAKEVLLGRRGRSDAFMPGWFVFPGGAVERADARRASLSELAPPVAAALERHARPPRARGLAVAALRETLEETGVAVGALDASGRLRPDLGRLRYIARAITPTESRIRFHARFFLCELAARDRAAEPLAGDGELHDLGWYPLERAVDLDILGVTRFVLEEAARTLEGRSAALPRYCYRGFAGRALRG